MSWGWSEVHVWREIRENDWSDWKKVNWESSKAQLLQLLAAKASLWAINKQPNGTSPSLTNSCYSVRLLTSHPGGCKQYDPIWLALKRETTRQKATTSPTHTHTHIHIPPLPSTMSCIISFIGQRRLIIEIKLIFPLGFPDAGYR